MKFAAGKDGRGYELCDSGFNIERGIYHVKLLARNIHYHGRRKNPYTVFVKPYELSILSSAKVFYDKPSIECREILQDVWFDYLELFLDDFNNGISILASKNSEDGWDEYEFLCLGNAEEKQVISESAIRYFKKHYPLMRYVQMVNMRNQNVDLIRMK